MADQTSEQICAYSTCERRLPISGLQRGQPRKYCSDSCRVKANQQRRIREIEEPLEALRRAVGNAQAQLGSDAVDFALAVDVVPDDVRREVIELRATIDSVARRIPPAAG